MSGDGPLSVVLCTWNRSALLRGALEALMRQQDAPPHEILVVDNASSDDTREVVARFGGPVRYLVETRQGLSHARNAGSAAASGSLVAFTDDDVRVGERWMRSVVDACGRHPDAACVGGPVLPAWPGAVPAWLTERHWAPLGVQDYGRAAVRVDGARPLCLIGANLVLRRSALDAIGGFDPAVQRVGDGGGSTEDHACHLRLWAAGMHGVYDPSLQVTSVVTRERISKRYHRGWHYVHGQHVARMRLPEIETTHHRVLNVPGHLLRQALADAREWIVRMLRRDEAGAFEREARLCFAAGFLRERLR